MINIQLFSSNSETISKGHKRQEKNHNDRVLQDIKDKDNKRKESKKETDWLFKKFRFN